MYTKVVDELQLKALCEAEWKGDPALREEFEDDFEAFWHYSKAVNAGLIRRLGSESE